MFISFKTCISWGRWHDQGFFGDTKYAHRIFIECPQVSRATSSILEPLEPHFPYGPTVLHFMVLHPSFLRLSFTNQTDLAQCGEPPSSTSSAPGLRCGPRPRSRRFLWQLSAHKPQRQPCLSAMWKKRCAHVGEKT